MNTRFNSVDEALASLPRAVAPARDLWPAIARELDVQRGDDVLEFEPRRTVRTVTTSWPLALAASLAVVGLVGALCWSVLQERPAAGLVASSTPPPATARTLVNFEPVHNADYLSARAGLERVFNERLKLLAPATQAVIKADLETIRRANADIRAALARDPASPLLLKLLQSTGQQEIDLYTSVAQTTEPMLSRRT
jgi:hypothetical protein